MVKHVTGTASQECGWWFINLWGKSKKIVDINFEKHKHQVSAEVYSVIYIYTVYTQCGPPYIAKLVELQ